MKKTLNEFSYFWERFWSLYLASLINKKNSNVIVKQKYYKFIKADPI